MNKAHTIFLNPKDGKIVKAETLQAAIELHPEVKMVVLFWTWTECFYTSNAGPFEAYVSPSDIDEEYSFFGDREDALKFADGYDCWDGDDFVLMPISDGYVLYGYRDEYDEQCSWSDGYDHINGITAGYDPSWFSFIRVDFDYETGTEYVLNPIPLPRGE